MNRMLHDRRHRQSQYIVKVTFVNHSQTKNNTGIPTDNIWYEDRVDYGIVIRGKRMDFTNNPMLVAMVYADSGGYLNIPAVGDFVLVEDKSEGTLPRVVGVVHGMSRDLPASDKDAPAPSGTWDLSTKHYSRPIAPQLESPGNRGIVYNYNPIFITYHEKYEDSDATDPDFGKWYDRFVLFDSSDTYKNKKSLIDYNPAWVKEALDAKEKHLTDIVWNVTESWDNDYRELDRFFYLAEERYPYRPDPVFDRVSDYHQEKETDFVLRNNEGGVSYFDKFDTDLYPMPINLQEINPAKLAYTAYDEIINETLAEIRREAGNIANADMPYEAKEEKQIRIGRNKLVISDVHGDGSQIFVTLKTQGDQQLTFLLDDTQAETMSQVRIRGLHGETVFLESKGSDKATANSRIILKGVEGQFVELYDDAKTKENYIYLVSSEGDNLKDSFSLNRASYTLLTNKKFPAKFKRLANNGGLPNLGQMAVTGMYDSNRGYSSYRHEFYDERKNEINSVNFMQGNGRVVSDTKNYQFNPDIVTHTVNRTMPGGIFVNEESKLTPGNATKEQSVFFQGNYVNYKYDALTKKYEMTNTDLSKIEMIGPRIEVYALAEVHINSDTMVRFADGNKPVARLGDQVSVAGMIGTIIQGNPKVIG